MTLNFGIFVAASFSLINKNNTLLNIFLFLTILQKDYEHLHTITTISVSA